VDNSDVFEPKTDGLKPLNEHFPKPIVMNKAEEYYNSRYGEPADKHERKFQKHDYWDMIDFAEQYAQQEKREMWDDLAMGGLVCGTEDMRKGCIQCQTEYKKHCGESNHQNQER
jgi:hypothetical protein